MELLVGAFAVLLVVTLVEATPIRITPSYELVLIGAAAISASLLLFDKFDKQAVCWTFAIGGLSLLLRAVFRLVRAWADRTEVNNVLQMRRH